MQPEELRNSKLINTNEQSSCGEKDEDAPVAKLTKKVALKELAEIFHNIESAKDKLLKADIDLERMNQGTEKIP